MVLYTWPSLLSELHIAKAIAMRWRCRVLDLRQLLWMCV